MKILYLMHVDWDWIKQRPQFLAEFLVKNNVGVDVFYNKYKANNLVKNDRSLFRNIAPIPYLRGSRFKVIRYINRLLYILFLVLIQQKEKYDYIFITHPKFFSKVIKCKLIYDCMDDYVEFNKEKKDREIALITERKVISQSELVIFSAKYLQDVVKARQLTPVKRSIIVNNAIQMPSNDIKREVSNKNKDEIIITYIGTISEWFDFELLEEVKRLYKEKNIIFNLYGPVDLANRKDSCNFNFKGAINHDRIFDIMGESDILMMPFVVTDLIKSVNPVKLYEYIYSGKPTICVRYGESEKFDKQVYLYENGNPESFISQIQQIEQNGYRGKLDENEINLFIQNNTWESRGKQILEVL